jgi:hypothetical protein
VIELLCHQHRNALQGINMGLLETQPMLMNLDSYRIKTRATSSSADRKRVLVFSALA